MITPGPKTKQGVLDLDKMYPVKDDRRVLDCSVLCDHRWRPTGEIEHIDRFNYGDDELLRPPREFVCCRCGAKDWR